MSFFFWGGGLELRVPICQRQGDVVNFNKQVALSGNDFVHADHVRESLNTVE